MINHNNIRKNVLELVKTFPHLSENYNSLVGYYWIMYDHVSSAEDYNTATPVESITRNFRRLVSSGHVVLKGDSKRLREKQEREYKHEFSTLG